MNNIIFIGTNLFASKLLELLIENDIKISTVITKNPSKFGRGQKLTPQQVEITAKKYNICVHTTNDINTEKNIIKEKNIDLIIVTEFGMKIKKEILDIPKFGCINIHPSILPKFRGPSPIQYAILEGEEESGVSIIKMSEKIDCGDILKIEKCKIDTNDTYEILANKLVNLSVICIKEIIYEFNNNQIKPIKQLNYKNNYTKKIEKDLFKINWNDEAKNIERKTKALLIGKKSTFTYIKKKYIKILYATTIKSTIKEKAKNGEIVNIDKTGIYVSTKKDLIKIEKLQIEGKNITNIENIINSNNNLFAIGNIFS